MRAQRSSLLPALAPGLSTRARIAVYASCVLLALAVAGLALSDAGAFGHGAVAGVFNDWVYNCAEVLAAAVVLSRAVLVRRERAAWLTLGVGIAFYAAAEIYYTVVLEPMANPPSPSLADAGYLTFYLCAYVMIVRLVREHVRDFHASVWLDGAIGGLAVSGVGAALVLEPVIHATHGTFAAVATNLAYPLCDLLLLAFVVGVFALTGWRPGRTWLLIGAAFMTLAAADSVYLFRVAENSYAPGTVLDAMWPFGLLLIAFAAWCRPRPAREVRFEGVAMMIAPFVFAMPALFLLIRGAYVHQGPITEGLATGALLVALGRFALAFNEVRRLSDVRERQARTDELTGLSNRRHFYERLSDAVEGCAEREATFALLMVDLDHFKELNDTLGHYAGDLVLAQTGPRMQAVLRDGAIARLGGDEFGVILRDLGSAGAAAERIHEALARPFEIEGVSISVQASVGIAAFPRDANSAKRLLQCADVAMYQAKETRSRYAFYAAGSDQNSLARLSLVAELKGAIAEGQLEVHYQPQLRLRDLDVCGAEALVRWRHPARGLLGPDAFIDLAEHGGAMRELTAAVLEQALTAHRRWLDAGRELAVSVNVSATNLVDGTFLESLRAQLERLRTPPQMLALEITESVLIAEGPRVRAVLDSLAEMGVRLSLDDFGTGYSTLASLRDLPVGEIKIDRSFVSEVDSGGDTATIVEATVALAGRLGTQVVAEGIETRAQLEQLRELGCPLGQGYLFSRPLPAEEFAAWLEHAGELPDLYSPPQLSVLDELPTFARASALNL